MHTSTSTNWILIFLLLVAGMFAAAQFGKLILTLPQLRSLYPDGGAFVPVLVSLVGMVGIVLGAVAGAVVSRIGLNRALIGGLIAGAVLSFIEMTLPPLPIFAGLRVLEGMSHLCIVVAAPTLMSAFASDQDRPTVMGIWATFFGITLSIMVPTLPFVLQTGGLSLVFFGHGFGMLVIAALLYTRLPHRAASEPVRISYIDEHRAIYTTPQLFLPGAGFVGYTIIYIALLGVLPLVRDTPLWVLAALPLISIAGSLLGGLIARRLAPDRLVVLGFLGSAISAITIAVLPTALWPLFVLFLVLAMVPAASFASIPYFNASLSDRARATGGIAQFGNIGTTLGAPIFVTAGEFGGIGLISAMIVLFCSYGIITTLFLRRRIT